MTFTRYLGTAALLLTFGVAPAWADGQRRHPGGGDRGGSVSRGDGGGSRSGVAVPRGRGNPGPRSYGRPPDARPSGPAVRGYAVPRASSPGRSYRPPAAGNRFYGGSYSNRSNDRRYYDNRRFDNRRFDGRRFDGRGYDRRYYDRRYYNRSYYGRPYYGGYYNNYRGYGYGYDRYRYYGRGYRHYPFLTFRPRFSLSIGFFSGYPVPYTWAYPTYIPAYGYAPPVGVVVPGPATYGGVVFDVTPVDAEVWVDGEYAGTTTMFDGSQEPMSLAAGRHTIELRAPGCLPLVFAVNVLPGQVIPYRGALSPLP